MHPACMRHGFKFAISMMFIHNQCPKYTLHYDLFKLALVTLHVLDDVWVLVESCDLNFLFP
jgi:hypothetical protein